MTNADKIRQMTDEELVEAWYYIYYHVIFASTDSRRGLLDWLKQEVKMTKEEITGAIAVLEQLQEGYIKYESEKPEREIAANILAGALDVAITLMKQEVKCDA